MLYDVAALTLRVVPRSPRAAVERHGDGLVIRVQSPPEGGRATEEARRLVAEALGVPRAAVVLRTGARSRTKIYEIEGLSEAELRARVASIPGGRGG